MRRPLLLLLSLGVLACAVEVGLPWDATPTPTPEPTPTPQQAEWWSYNAVLNTSGIAGAVVLSTGGIAAELRFYVTSSANLAVPAALLDRYLVITTANNDHLRGYWDVVGETDGEPLVGKSAIGRGADTNEGSGGAIVPAPLGVFDLQLHAEVEFIGDEDRPASVAFVAPRSGIHRVTDLAFRRIHAGGASGCSVAGNVALLVAGEDGNPIQVANHNGPFPTWQTVSGEYTFVLSSGQALHIAARSLLVNENCQATEVQWRVQWSEF